ncbi:MerR family transcriptional regulator [Alteromonas facilis]|uniref:MerR family transcriptional regulator n=1 Tax=Alteromonas facilis TaxID=2048004 RepID=UPI000C290400|nr:MerR family transcriptional regulator [Alteromonas facilis]
MKASDVAKLSGIAKDTLRYYEKIGLITPPVRRNNGYRDYAETTLEELRFIKMAQSVGFTLQEIKPAIPFVKAPKPGCPLLTDAIVQQLNRIDQKIAELEQSKSTLNRWLDKLSSQQLTHKAS